MTLMMFEFIPDKESTDFYYFKYVMIKPFKM